MDGILGTDLGTEVVTSNGIQNTDGYVARHELSRYD